MIGQKTVRIIEDKNTWEYSTDELKAIIGKFEKEYNENAMGEVTHNEILGCVKEGTVEHALRLGAITKKEISGKYSYFIKLPEYRFYQERVDALNELYNRRDYAIKKSVE